MNQTHNQVTYATPETVKAKRGQLYVHQDGEIFIGVGKDIDWPEHWRLASLSSGTMYSHDSFFDGMESMFKYFTGTATITGDKEG